MSYSELSSVKKARALHDLEPDLIILDECHMLKSRKSARTRRFLDYMRTHPSTSLVAMSGTVTKDSLLDYWHIIKLTHKGESCPLPRAFQQVVDWDDAIGDRDVENQYTRKLAPGALMTWAVDGCHIRGYRDRLIQTPGVVATDSQAVDASIVISTLQYPIPPPEVKNALEDLERTWRTPGGEEIREATHKAMHAKALSAGFYYRWIWPDDVVNYRWLQARSEWNIYIREVLRRRYKGIDSPLQVAQACDQGRLDAATYNQWKSVRDEYTPETEAVWVSDYLIQHTIKWVKKNGPALVWVFHDAVGKALDAAGLEYIGGGPKSSKRILQLDGTESVALSAPAHHFGKNLQMYDKNLLTSSPSSGKLLEQLIGRTHRSGQKADVVTVSIMNNTQYLESALANALGEARYIEHSTGQTQKLNIARIVRA